MKAICRYARFGIRLVEPWGFSSRELFGGYCGLVTVVERNG